MPHQCKQMTYLWWRRRFRLRTAFFHSFSRSRLGDGNYPVDFQVAQNLPDAARPANFEFPYAAVGSQPEVYPDVARAGIAHGGSRLVPLRAPVLGGDAELRADAHAVAQAADRPEDDPMVARVREVVKQLGRAAKHGHHDIDAAIVVEVPESGSTVRRGEPQSGIRDLFEPPVSQVAEHRIGLGVPAGGVRISRFLGGA